MSRVPLKIPPRRQLHRFLNEAVNIGNQLVDSVERDEHGVKWRTMSMDANHETVLTVSETLYSGVSGIALFLIELYKQTGDEKYIITAKDALAWTEWYCDAHPEAGNYALLTGRMGAAYTLLRLYGVTNQKKYLQKALVIAEKCKTALHPRQLKEYIGGNAGTLLGLLHLHAASKETWLLEAIALYAQAITESARFGRYGIWWDAGPYQIRPLCGLSHGASGIGLVLLELGRYCNNPAFYKLAEQSFVYENTYFDAETGNWPDFRMSMWKTEQITGLEEAYKKGRLDVFNQASDTNTWCHGAAGIGLARIRAYELGSKGAHLKDAKRALAKVRRMRDHNPFGTFSLCHGVGGNADTLIESFILFGDTRDMQRAVQWGDLAIRQKEEAGRYVSGMGKDSAKEDASLFNGLAGIGYFLLRLHDPLTTPSILAPKLETTPLHTKASKNQPFLNITLPDLQERVVANTFPLSVHVVKESAPQLTKQFFADKTNAGPLKQSFIRFTKSLPSVTDTQKRTFELERLKIELIDQRLSGGLLRIKEGLNQKAMQSLLQLSDAALLRRRLQLTQECTPFAVSGNELYLLKLTATQVEQLPISQFCFLVLKEFTKPKQPTEVAAALAQRYGVQDKQGIQIIQKKVVAQAREAISSTILVAAQT